MKDEKCICDYCAFKDACPSAYFFPRGTQECADLRDMRKNKRSEDK